MNVGFVGLGKLGLPVALAIEQKGHTVFGWDINPKVRDNIIKRYIPYVEEGSDVALLNSTIEISDVYTIVRDADIIFISVQTPHEPEFEGVTPLSDMRSDFDYSYLIDAVVKVANEAVLQEKNIALVIISTVLPTTIDRHIRPRLNQFVHLAYNPAFIAMGTTMKDFLNPEFVLCGVDSRFTANKLKFFYRTITDAPFVEMNIAEAELTKVAYNTFIGMKIIFANTLMEICYRIGGMNVDVVTDALKMAKRRLISPAYLSGGMGDGGGCHPRDNIALSWLAREFGLYHDIFSDIMECREDQALFLAHFIQHVSLTRNKNLPIMILGYTFKPETNLTVGSPAILLKNLLKDGLLIEAEMSDPFVDDGSSISPVTASPKIFFIGTKHAEFAEYQFPTGSVVIDPFRYIPDQEGVEVIRIGA